MKKILFLALISGFLLLSVGCKDDDQNSNGTKPTAQLDANLFGIWSHGDPNEPGYVLWHFKSDATLRQSLNGYEYNWLWCIEDGKIKMYVKGGVPRYQIYRIEGNLLYLWSDYIDDWGVPLTKEE